MRDQETVIETLSNGNSIAYRIVNGTAYHQETADIVVQTLEDARRMGTRLMIHYGDAATGQAWGDIETGRIGRSTGRIKIPLTVHNRRSMGGPGLLDHCIVKIETASGKLCVYTHPQFQAA